MKYNLERFTGNRRVVELADGATKGATVGVDLFYNGVLVLWEDIYNGASAGGVTPIQPGTTITAWSLILDIPPNIIALSELSGTGIVVRTGDSSFSLRDITSVDGSVTITNPGGVAGDIDLSASGGGVPYYISDGQSYTVPEFVQALFTIPIDLGVGSSLLIDGILVEVD